MTYDARNRVLTASTGLDGVQPLVLLTNSYDAVSNRISLTDDAGVSGEPGSQLSMDAGARNQLYPLFRWRDCGPMHRGT